MARATWQDSALADSDEVVVIESSLYFPRATVRVDLPRAMGTRTCCPWKGQAPYYSVIEGGEILERAAWS